MPDDFVNDILERIVRLTARFELALEASDWETIAALDLEVRSTLDFQSFASVLREPEARTHAVAALSELAETHRKALNRAIAQRQEIADTLYRFRRERDAAETYHSVLRDSE